ncbi:histone-lysine N-methyltransferase 2C-like isoform X3 [Ornithodoros turicata]|uniref:histone-lysine N-methyltransferase 2C-like isoform X3 n=1 Tax=Ornithodoros turicata TaxID=34597 RepID=UPI003139084A
MDGGAELMKDGGADPPSEQQPPPPSSSSSPGVRVGGGDASSEDGGVLPEAPTTPSEVGSEAPYVATPERPELEDGAQLEGPCLLKIEPEVTVPVALCTEGGGSPQVVRRGPGRPRKDGSGPVQRKKIHSSFPGRPRVRSRKPGLLSLQHPGSLVGPDLMTSGGLEQESDPQLPLAPFPATTSDAGYDGDMPLEPGVERLDELSTHERQERVCSLCGLGDGSHYGQGKLLRAEPTPGFCPQLRRPPRFRRVSADADMAVGSLGKPVVPRRGKPKSIKPLRGKSLARCSLDSKMTSTDDGFSVGFAEEPDVVTLFEATGHTLVHHNCASWSESVCQSEDGTLLNVDKAVFAGITQACSGCQKFGATIRCHVADCTQIFHFPCAAGYGCFQDMKALMLLCPHHAIKAPSFVGSQAQCQSCAELGSVSDLLLCVQCGTHVHGYCLDPPVLANPSARAGWQCPDCKICQVCSQSGDETKLMSCDTCDKGFHTYCAKPVMASVPKHGWKCQNCRVCGDCGSRTPGSGPSSRWHMNFSVCDSCYQQRNKGVACPLCGKAYRQFTHRRDMTQCTVCRKFIHAECDPQLSATRETDYVCPVCNNTRQQANISQSSKIDSSTRLRIPASDGSPGYMPSPACGNDDSRSSTDNDPQQPFRVAQQSPSDFMGIERRPSPAHHSLGKPPLARYSGKRRYSVGKPRQQFYGGWITASGRFAAKRRDKAVELRRKRGPKQKHKSFFLGCNVPHAGVPVIPESKEAKQDEEPAMDNKMVLFSANDDFVLSQDLCAMCGSFGRAEEGRLISCAQCGQCYHPYCVNVKVTKIILKKGWRCLDCTVCEGCGKPHDESRLLLCDECDISYHTYCLNPPLDTVPKGNWKCQWCVVCLQCGSTDPGYGSQWQCNYTKCGPCASHVVCPVCTNEYIENDLVIQCVQCERWLHGQCDQIFCEEDAEKCAEFGYNCIFCRPKDEILPHLTIDYGATPSPPPCDSPPPQSAITASKATKEVAEPPVKAKPPPPQFVLDGVFLSESGLHHIKSLTMEQPKRPRVRRPRMPSGGPSSSLPIIPLGAAFRGRLSTEDSEDTKELLDLDIDTRMEAEDEAKLASEEVPKADVEIELKKKRQRKLHKLGIGGFMAKPRGRSLSAKEHDSLSLGLGSEAGSEATSAPTQTGEGTSQVPEGATEGSAPGPEKPKRRRRVRRKNPLEDSFPSYLQEAFFGHDLLVTSRTEPAPEMPSDDDEDSVGPKSHTEDNVIVIASSHSAGDKNKQQPSTTSSSLSASTALQEIESVKDSLGLHGRLSATPPKGGSDDEDLGLKDILPHDLPQDDELMDMLMNDNDDLSKPDSGLDDVNLPEQGDSRATGDDESTGGAKDDPLSGNIDTVLLSPHFNLDSMVSVSSGLPHMDSKDVEDVFKGVLSPTDTCGPSEARMGTLSPLQASTTGSSGRPSLQNPLTPVSSHGMGSPFSVPPPSPFPMEYGSPQLSEPPPSPWTDPDTDLPSSGSQKNILKWESDEALGPNATISPVLYANLNCQNLRLEYPSWTERSKQIAKIWRNLPPDKRQPFLQMARENRANSRIQKSQDPGKVVREQKSPRELEQERQWKQLQHMRQQQTQSPHPAQHLLPADQQTRSNVGKSHQMMLGECTSPAGSLSPSAPSPTSSQKIGASAQSPLSPAAAQRSPGPVRIPQAPMSPLIQVSRVRPPIDPSRLPPSESPYPLQGLTTPGPSDATRFVHPARPPPLGSATHTPPHTPVPYPVSPRPSSTAPVDPYAQMVGTPRPSTSEVGYHVRTPPMARPPRPQTLDPYASQPATPRPSQGADPFPSQSSATEQPQPHVQYSPQGGFVGPRVSQEGYIRTSQGGDSFSPGPPQRSPDPFGGPDPYARPIGTPRPSMRPDDDGSQAVAKQQLRDLLQRQMKKQQDPTSPLPPAAVVQPQQRMAQPWQQPQPGMIVQGSRMVLSSGGAELGFRAPLPPGAAAKMALPGDQQGGFPHPVGTVLPGILDPRGQQQGGPLRAPVSDVRLRMLILQQRQQLRHQHWQQHIQQQRMALGRPPAPVPTSPGGLPSMGSIGPDGFPGQRAVAPQAQSLQQQQQHSPVTRGIPFNQQAPADAQEGVELPDGSFLTSSTSSSTFPVKQESVSQGAKTTASGPLAAQVGSSAAKLPAKPQKKEQSAQGEARIPSVAHGTHHHVAAEVAKKKTTAGDLVKEVEAQGGAEDPEEAIGDMEDDLDDDELLGLGNDFNILEYADPELDKAFGGEGEKSNILDEHLDLDDKEDDLDEVGEMKSRAEAEVKEEPGSREQKPNVSTSSDPHKVKVKPKETTQPNFPDFPQPTRSTPQNVAGFPLHEASRVSRAPSAPFGTSEVVTGLPTPAMRPPPPYAPSPVTRTVVRPPPSTDRPLLLQEQPLLLEDLVEQEKREQRRTQCGSDAATPTTSLLSDVDFERLKEDVLSGPPDDSIGGPVAPLLPPVVSPVVVPQQHAIVGHRFAHVHMPPQQQQQQGWGGHDMGMRQPMMGGGAPGGGMRMMGPHRPDHLSPGSTPPSAGPPQLPPIQSLPAPPAPPSMPPTLGVDPEQHRLQLAQYQAAVATYEQWLAQQEALLGSQKKVLETEVGKLRKAKKALSSKQRQLTKAGQELPQHNAMELMRIAQEQPSLQKQLDQVRKLYRQHTMVLQEYRAKQQKRQQQQQMQQQQMQQHQMQQQQMQQQGHMGSMMGGPGMGGPQLGGPTVPTPGKLVQQHPQHSQHVSVSGAGVPGPPPSPMPPPSSPMGSLCPSPRMQPPSSPLMQHSPMSAPSPLLSQLSPQQPSPRTPRPPSLHLVSQDEQGLLGDGYQHRESMDKMQQMMPTVLQGMLPQRSPHPEGSEVGDGEDFQQHHPSPQQQQQVQQQQAQQQQQQQHQQQLQQMQLQQQLQQQQLQQQQLQQQQLQQQQLQQQKHQQYQQQQQVQQQLQHHQQFQQQQVPSGKEASMGMHQGPPRHQSTGGVPMVRPFSQQDQQHPMIHPRFPGSTQIPRYLIRQGDFQLKNLATTPLSGSDPLSQHPPGHPYLQRTGGGVHPMMRPPPPYPDHLRKPPPSPSPSPGHTSSAPDTPTADTDPSRTPPSLSRPNSQPALQSPDPRSSPMERHFSPGTPSSSSSLPQRSPAVSMSAPDEIRNDAGDRSVESLSDLLSRVSKTPSESPSPQSRHEQATEVPSPGRSVHEGTTPPLSKQESILQYLRAGSVGSPASNSNSSRSSMEASGGTTPGAGGDPTTPCASENPQCPPTSAYQCVSLSPTSSPTPSTYILQTSQAVTMADTFTSEGGDGMPSLHMRQQMIRVGQGTMTVPASSGFLRGATPQQQQRMQFMQQIRQQQMLMQQQQSQYVPQQQGLAIRRLPGPRQFPDPQFARAAFYRANSPARNFGVRPGGGNNPPTSGLPGGSPHTVGGGRGAPPTSPPKATASTDVGGSEESSTPTQSLLHRVAESGSSSFGGSTFHVGPSSTLMSYGADQLATSVFVSLDYPATATHDGCVSSEVLLSLEDGSSGTPQEEEEMDSSRVALLVVGDEDALAEPPERQEEPLDVAVVVETVGPLATPEPELQGDDTPRGEDESSPSGSEGADMSIHSGCTDVLHSGDHNYSNPPPCAVEEDFERIPEERSLFCQDETPAEIKTEDLPVEDSDTAPEEKNSLERYTPEREPSPQVNLPSPPALTATGASSMSFPSSVTHTLNFTLRQTGMPQTVRLPHDESQVIVLPAKPVVPQLSPSPPAEHQLKSEPVSVPPTPPHMVYRMHPSTQGITPPATPSKPMRWLRGPETGHVAIKEEVSVQPLPTPQVTVKQEEKSAPSPCQMACHKQEEETDVGEDVERRTPQQADGLCEPSPTSQGDQGGSNSCDVTPEQRVLVTPPPGTPTLQAVPVMEPPTAAPPAVVKVEATPVEAACAGGAEMLTPEVDEKPSLGGCAVNADSIDSMMSNEQNVLLKQLLQNCPSAETQTSEADTVEPEKGSTAPASKPVAVPVQAADVCSTQPSQPVVIAQAEGSVDQKPTPGSATTEILPSTTTPPASASAHTLTDGDKMEESKGRKLSYLDIRRAQLEREPTPPPPTAEDLALKRQQQRKRPKKPRPPPTTVSPSELSSSSVAPTRPSPKAKRPRKGSRGAEEDYELFVEALMVRLRALPPLRILEPLIRPNFNIGVAFGRGDLNLRETPLKGSFGKATLPSQADVYASFPFGDQPPPPVTPSSVVNPSPTPLRGFYNQEFSMHTRVTSGGADSNRCRDVDSPDSIVGASSPESAMFDAPYNFRGLQLIDEDSNDSSRSLSSPTVPIVAPIPVKAVPVPALKPFTDEKDKENAFPGAVRPKVCLPGQAFGGGPPTPLRDSANVSVTLTLTSEAVGDIRGVLCSLAKLLQIEPPSSYDIIERTTTPPSQKLGLYSNKNKEVTLEEEAEYLVDGKQRFCRHCEIMVSRSGAVKKQASQLQSSGSPKEEQDEEAVYFCSSNCYMQYALAHRAVSIPLRKEAALVCHEAREEPPSEERGISARDDLQQQEDDGLSKVSELEAAMKDDDEEQTGTESRTGSALECRPEPEDDLEGRSLADDEASPASEGTPHRKRSAKHALSIRAAKDQEPMLKKWKDIRWKFWSVKLVNPPTYNTTSEDVSRLLDAQDICVKPEKPVEDTRRCILCHDVGDGETNGPARLLNMEVDVWVHLNCALWSQEVYETVNGALMNVASACRRACLLTCTRCHRTGASLRCFRLRCTNAYHFPCATREGCSFFKDKTILCPTHTPRIQNLENVLESVAVFRRVYINRDEHKQVASMIHKGEQHLLRVGSLIFLNIGQLLPHQLQAFHTPSCIYPVGFKVIRIYWSMHQLGARSRYFCSIKDLNGRPQFEIRVTENGKETVLTHLTPKGVWQKVLQPIENFRREAQAIKVFSNFITGEDLFGLTEPAIVRIIESLPGVDTLNDYSFRYGRSPFLELPLAINPTGCARAEPKLRTHFKRPHTLHTSHSSRLSLQTTGASGMMGACGDSSSPYTKHFVHSKSSQYRRMKTEWRNNVYLARSRIQGLGLYATRDLDKHTMVIEYIGQLIRNEIAERNEAIYEAQNRGVYMFRLEENRVIDATLSGGLARYMNHSCSPNCVAEVVQIDRENKILITTNRRITRGEELTYDYKFDVEDDQHKIPCLCGAPNCRKWMN